VAQGECIVSQVGSARRRAMDRLERWIANRPATVVVVTALLAAVCALYSWRSLRLDADTNSLIGDNQPFMRGYRAFNQEFGDLEFLLVVVDPQGNEPAADKAVHDIVTGMRAIPELPEVVGFVDSAEQLRVSAWAMADAELSTMHLARGALATLASQPGCGGLLAASSERLQKLLRDGAGMTEPTRRAFAAEAFLMARCALGGMPDAPQSLATPRTDQWLLADGGHLRLVLVMPMKSYDTLAVIEKPLQAMREVITRVRHAYPAVQIGLTGRPVLQADEMSTTNDDMNVASVIALVLCVALFMIVFRGVKRPLLAMLAFLAGCALTYGAATLLVGRLNLLSVVFMLVLVGVGLDYGIHMIARYLEGLRHLGSAGSVRHMMRSAVPSMLAGAATSAGTFLIAMVAPMQGLRELGLISGVGLLLCAVTMAITLPALLMLVDRNAHKRPLRRGFFEEPLDGRVDRFDGRAAKRHYILLAFSIVLAIVGGWIGVRGVTFESNLLRLQAVGLESAGWQRRLQQEGGNATWFGACTVDATDQIAPLLARAAAEPLIGRVRSVLDLVPSDTPERARLRGEIGAAALTLPAAQKQIATPELADRTAQACADLAALAGLAGAPTDEVRSIESLRDALRRFNKALRVSPDAMVREAEQAARRASVAAQMIGVGARATLRDALPTAVRDTFVSTTGRCAVILHPTEDVWEGDAMDRFVAAMRRVDAQVTGVPITVSESIKLMRRSFFEQGLLATLFVALLLLLDFRSWKLAALSLLSLGIGLAWTFGLMAALHIPFNLANFFAIPIMIGLAVDSCIHVTHRAVDGGLQVGFGSTRRAVIVTALTTTIGFGTLLWAQHLGLRSLGAVMSIASLCCLVSSVWLLPAMLRIAGFGRIQLPPSSANA